MPTCCFRRSTGTQVRVAPISRSSFLLSLTSIRYGPRYAASSGPMTAPLRTYTWNASWTPTRRSLSASLAGFQHVVWAAVRGVQWSDDCSLAHVHVGCLLDTHLSPPLRPVRLLGLLLPLISTSCLARSCWVSWQASRARAGSTTSRTGPGVTTATVEASGLPSRAAEAATACPLGRGSTSHHRLFFFFWATNTPNVANKPLLDGSTR